jgi:Ras-related protein Rab-24
VERYLHKRFHENNPVTVGAAFNAKRITLSQSGREDTLVIGIWDTAGTERYRAMSRLYYKAAQVALLCFDCRSKAGFEDLKFWVDELREAEPMCILFLVACKTDLRDEGSVAPEAMRNYASSIDAHLFETVRCVIVTACYNIALFF